MNRSTRSLWLTQLSVLAVVVVVGLVVVVFVVEVVVVGVVVDFEAVVVWPNFVVGTPNCEQKQ